MKDITLKYKDTLVSVVYDLIKDYIEWKEVQKFFPNKLFLYSKSKKCQMLLALMDGVSNHCRKFNLDNNDQMDFLYKYLAEFRFTRSTQYMKAFRNHFLVDVFGFCQDYDRVLKAAKYSVDEALTMVNDLNTTMITTMATDLSNDINHFMQTESELRKSANYDISESYKKSLNEFNMSVMLSDAIMDMADQLQCNYKRSVVNVVGLLFDIQLLSILAFDERYDNLQKDLDEWDILEAKQRFDNVVTYIMETVINTCGLECDIKYELNKERMCREHIFYFKFAWDEEKLNDKFSLDFILSIDSPIIIES